MNLAVQNSLISSKKRLWYEVIMDLLDLLKENGLSIEPLLKKVVLSCSEDVNAATRFESSAIEKKFTAILSYLAALPQVSDEDGQSLLSRVCIPCLIKLSPTEETDKLVIQCVCKVFVYVFQKCPTQTKSFMLSQLLALSKATNITTQGPLGGERAQKMTIDVGVLVQTLPVVLTQIDLPTMESSDKLLHVSSELFECMLAYLPYVDKRLCYQLCSGVLPCFIVGTKDGHNRLSRVWSIAEGAYKNQINIEMSALNLVLTILCCFAHQFLSSSDNNRSSLLLDLRNSSMFWAVVQEGFGSSDPLNRKRSAFLLQCSLKSVSTSKDDFSTSDKVFWWNKKHEAQLNKVWEAVVLLLETLEEKQVHIVKPVLPRMKLLISATQNVIDDQALLHITWLYVILRRTFVHESKTIIKWGVMDFLTMPMDNSPLKHSAFWPFLFSDMISILNDSSIYVREQDMPLGSCPTIASAFVKFTVNLVQNLPNKKKGEFLIRFIEAVTAHKMADVPLVFMAYALSKIPPQPILSSEFLTIARELILTCLDTHSIPMRSAIQCFLLTAITNLSIKVEVSYHDVAHMLGALRVNECLSFDSVAWKQASRWLTEITRGRQMNDCLVEFSKKTIEGVIGAKTDDASLKISYSARLLLLFIYSTIKDDNFFELVSKSGNSVKDLVGGLILPVIDVIVKAHTHAYLSKAVINNALELLVLMLAELPSYATQTGSLLYQIVEPWILEILLYIQQELFIGSKMPPFPDLVYAKSFLDAWDTLYRFLEINCSTMKESVLAQFESRCCEELNNAAGLKELFLSSTLHGSMTIASWLCGKKNSPSSNDPLLECFSKLLLQVELLKPTQHTSHGDTKEGNERLAEELNKEWGPVVSHYLQCHWECVLYYKTAVSVCCQIKHVDTTSLITIQCTDPMLLADACISSLDAGCSSAIVTICKCMALLVPELYQASCDVLCDHINTLWKLVLEQRNKRKLFSEALSSFLPFAFHPLLLVTHSSTNEQLYTVLEQIVSEFQELGELKTGIFNILVSHCCHAWLRAADKNSPNLQSSLICFSHFIKDALLFGPVYKRNLRVATDVNYFIESLGEECSSNSLHLRPLQGDSHVRLTVTLFLVQLAEKSNISWVTQSFLPHLAQLLLQKGCEEISAKSKCFINSLSHRVRSRLWQAILILVPYMQQSTVKDMLPQIFKATESGDQFSVRYLQEWAASYVFTVHPTLLPTLWKYLENDTPNKLCLMVSVLTATSQVGRCLGSDENKVYFLRKALPLVTKWTNSHHFMTKLYAQSCLVYLWDLYNEISTSKMDHELGYLNTIVEFVRRYGDIARCKKRMDNNSFYTLCHAVKDFSFESVYYIIPLLSQLSSEEFILRSDFKLSEFWSDSLRISLQCTNQSLLTAASEEERRHYGKDISQVEDEPAMSDVQKKITPWSSSNDAILNELFPDLSSTSVDNPKQNKPGRLILVASLLHKPPNLGGLCRTCEIFGVTQLVLNNINIIEDAQFQALSVSAERWVPITQVRVPQLEEYLMEMKQQGYSLVGVEQTAHSKCLTSYNFPLKTVLLLGNEREGIPVQLIHMLDECVEIPQLGIIRSLNVHISGALLIWEYTKQHGFKLKEDT